MVKQWWAPASQMTYLTLTLIAHLLIVKAGTDVGTLFLLSAIFFH